MGFMMCAIGDFLSDQNSYNNLPRLCLQLLAMNYDSKFGLHLQSLTY